MDYLGFDKATFEAFKADDRAGPIHMLNLVKLKDTATYEDGTTCSGAEAYAAYGRESQPVFDRLGGRIVWRGKMELMVIGPKDGSEAWDLCFIAEYPSPAAFVEMVYDPLYRKAMRHRQAGVQTSRLVRMMPQEAGENFGQ
ncbi:MAG: DUF1330 domain-containing protein [Paracoccaceae bacterium]